MSKACVGVPGTGLLQQLASRPLRTFPDPVTINELAQGCKVSKLEIIKASARSSCTNVSDDDQDQVRIPGFDNVRPIGGEPQRKKAYGLWTIEAMQQHGDSVTQYEIEGMAVYDPGSNEGDDY